MTEPRSRAGMGLTAKARELLAYIASCDLCPTYEEMRAALGVASKSNIYRLLGQLEERGYIYRLPNRTRAIEVLRLPDKPLPRPSNQAKYPGTIYLPLHGRIA